MRPTHLALLLVSLPLVGCPPTLGNDDDDAANDDDATGDDDDVMDDDDIVDDDDVDADCDSDSAGLTLSSPIGFDSEGRWYEGDLRLEGDSLIVTQFDGSEVEVRSSLGGSTFAGVQGSGRVFWQTPFNTFAGTDAVLAVEGWSPWFRAVHANTAVLPESIASEWSFWLSPGAELCGEPRRDECGTSFGLPLTLSMLSISDGMVYDAELYPGETFFPDGSFAVQHRGGRVWEDVLCPDWPSIDYAWTYYQAFDEVVIGLQ